MRIIESADQLATLLSNVQRGGHLEYTADPPCHQSASGMSFHFGDGPNGGVVMTCWNHSGCNGAGWARRVEDALGVRIRYVRPDGTLAYSGGAPSSRTRPTRPVQAPEGTPRRRTHTRSPASGGARPETLRELLELECWFVGNGKAPGTRGRWGKPAEAYRQSKPMEKGGVRLCRYGSNGVVVEESSGGRIYEVVILPWGRYADIRAKAEVWNLMSPAGRFYRASIALSADKRTPPVTQLAVLNFDYQPGADPDGLGAGARDSILRWLTDAGVPCYRSNSGNGFHGLVLARPDGQDWRTALPLKKWHGAQLEIFPPGSKRLVAFNPEQPTLGPAAAGGGARIPEMTWGELKSALRGAK